MEGELVSDKSSPEGAGQPASSYSEIFWQGLPQYLAMGMTTNEYWDGDPQLAKAFRECHKIKLRQENEILWLQGMYVYQSILLCAPRLNTLQPKEPIDYPKKPFDIFPDESKKTSQTDENDLKLAKVKAWMERNNKKWQK